MPIDAKRVQSVFLAASEIADPADRARFLDEACDGDAGLKSRVEALLQAHDQPDSLLDQPAVPARDPNSAATIGHEGGAAVGDEVPLGFLAPATRPDSLGRIGHYEVLQVLGTGGFGIVFRAFDDVLQRVVAVKVLSPQVAATSPARKRFLREARSSAQVRHENVVQVYEVGEQPLPYIAMEFIPGETLQQWLDRIGPIDAADVVRIGRQIAEGLAAAHATDLVHRDIKPGNILLEGGTQRVKITDFGLARAADDASISQSGIIAGTPMYMAPEQAKGETLDQRADLFSLGSVLYVMAAGRPPFRANGTLAVLKRVAEDTPRPIREIIPEVPEWLCRIVEKLHAKDPDARFQSAREVADVLADCEAQLRSHKELKDFGRIPEAKVTPVRPRRRQRRKLVAAALLLLAVGLTWGGLTAQKRGWENTFRYLASDSVVDVGRDSNVIEVIIIKKDGETVLTFSNNFGFRPLPPGTYQLQIVTRPGYEPANVDFDVSGFGGSTGMWSVQPSNGHYDLVMHRGSKVIVFVTARVSQAGEDKARLQGRWRRVSTTRHGNPVPVFDLMSVDRIEFIGDRQIAYWNGKAWHGMFTLNTAADPRELDLMSPDYGPTYSPLRTIYRFEGDQLVIAQGLPGKARPTGFTATQTAADFTVATYARIDVKELPPASLSPTFKNSIGMEFVVVPKGKSWLGGGKDRLGDKEVDIPADFYLGKFEVTQEEWETITGLTPSYFSRSNELVKDTLKEIKDADLKRFPVENVSWEDCQVFLERLNKQEKEKGWVYRLPTAAEWEYACRGGPMADKQDSAFDFYFAKRTNTLLPEQANYLQKDLNRPCKVGAFEANALGLCDMHGNVWEWCDDSEKAPDGASHRLILGGASGSASGDCRAAIRHTYPQSGRGIGIGLRLARVPSGAPAPEAKTPPTDPDRRAAEYVLSLGGVVEINRNTEIKALINLPDKVSGRAFRLTRAGLGNNPEVTDAGLAALKGCQNLNILDLTDTRVTDAGLAHLAGLSELKTLLLAKTKVTAKGVDGLAKALPKCKITWEGGVIEPK